MIGGYPALTQTKIRVDFPISAEDVDPANPAEGNFRRVVQAGVDAMLPGDWSRAEQRALGGILTANTQFMVRDAVVRDPSVIGGTLTLEVPAADPFDQLNKGLVDRDTPVDRRRVDDQQIAWFDQLADDGRVTRPINWGLVFNSNSRFPETAGLAGAIVGSFYVLLVCFLVSFPAGIAAAVYLEEFAPKNRITDLIEVNINNLAAVPSIIFGLLGLAVFIQTFGLPRSAPLVGGLVLSLMTLPTIIIVTRNALKAVPPSIREAAYGVGASKHQVIMHHVLPLGDAGHPHRHDHRPRARAGRDRAAAPHRHERLHHQPARRRARGGDGAPDPDLHLGRQPRARLRLAHLGRHPGAARLPPRHERHRHLPAPAAGADVVARKGKLAYVEHHG